MAVLINGSSASASEITAAALRDAHRRHAWSASAPPARSRPPSLIPLPGGGGLQIAVAAASAPDSTTQLDGVGITPRCDIVATRTLADYPGRDPQVDDAVSALANAPPRSRAGQCPRSARPTISCWRPPCLVRDVPTNDRLTVANQWQRLDFLHPNELIDQNGGAPDPVALRQTLRPRLSR